MTYRRSTKSHPVIGIVILIVGISVGAFGYKEYSKVATLIQQGVPTKGQVIKIESFRANQQGSQTQYSPVVQWQANGSTYSKKARFGSVRSSDYQVGQSIGVVYDPAHPGRALVFEGGSRPKLRITDYVFLIVGGIFSLAGLITFIKSFS